MRCRSYDDYGAGWEKAARKFGSTFGPDGPFGPRGPFGPDGPFGPSGPFGPGNPFGARGGRGGSGRRGRMFGQGELRLALLKLVADQPRHGYELIKALEEMTGGTYAPSPGAVYPTLQLLADEGMIAEHGDGGTRKAFAATDAGREELTRRADEVAELFARLDQHGAHQERVRAPEIMRAVGNLGQAVRNRVAAGKLDQATLNALVDLIDETAKRVERL